MFFFNRTAHDMTEGTELTEGSDVSEGRDVTEGTHVTEGGDFLTSLGCLLSTCLISRGRTIFV